MEIQAKIEEKVVKGKFVTVTLTPESVERVVAVLKDLVKKAKPDRYEEFIIKDLMKALENPCPWIVKESLPAADGIPLENEERKEKSKEITSEDKSRMVTEIKKRLDPKNEKNMATFVQESIDFGKKSFGIKTLPVAQTEEAFWDWLYENKIINLDGSPVSSRS